MSFTQSAEPAMAGIKFVNIALINILPLFEEDSKLRDLTNSLRRLVEATHPVALREIPATRGFQLPIPGCETEGPEAIYLAGEGFSVVVFVTGLECGGQVIGVASTRSHFINTLFGEAKIKEIDEAVRWMSSESLPTFPSWEAFCRGFSTEQVLPASAIDTLYPVMDSFWQHECDCHQEELA